MRCETQYRVGGVSCSVELDYRQTASVSRNCKRNDAPPLVARGQALKHSRKFASRSRAGIDGFQQPENT
jgi:hypothetical protein